MVAVVGGVGGCDEAFDKLSHRRLAVERLLNGVFKLELHC
jgi:hypothetical protein